MNYTLYFSLLTAFTFPLTLLASFIFLLEMWVQEKYKWKVRSYWYSESGLMQTVTACMG